MPATSEARILANRKNAARSTGPKTPEGKAASRRNGLKHGLTGSGVVLADQDGPEVERRAAALMAELDPKSTLGRVLVGQMATLSVRMERGARQEEAALAGRVRHASADFDARRVDLAESLFDAIADDPRRRLIELRRSPEGVDRLLEAWAGLRANLTRTGAPNGWEASDHATFLHLLGLRPEAAKGTRVEWLSRVLRVAHAPAPAPEPGCLGLDDPSRRLWAKDRLIERIDAEVSDLEQHRATFDLDAIAQDQLDAAEVALFDPSREASLARRYEAEARRGFFRSLGEFRRAEEGAKTVVTREAEAPMIAEPAPAEVAAPLASSCAEPSPTLRQPEPVAEREPFWPPHRFDGVARGLDGRVLSVGRSVVVPR